MYKPKEAEIPLRRSELISPNGVGAITTNSDGINMLPAALDYWYDAGENLNASKFKVDENRLKNIFNVSEFRLPPDYRTASGYSQKNSEANLNMKIPMLRFPNYHYCSHCKVMTKTKNEITKNSKIPCPVCDNKFARLIQVPLIVACEHGHLDDFPWNEWVHGILKPACKGPLKFLSTGGATLSTMKIVCTACNKQRGLNGLTTRDSKVLYDQLAEDAHYKCTGRKPWFGDSAKNSDCGCIPQPILRNATNAYYPQVLSAIYVPVTNNAELTKIIELYEQPEIAKKINRYTEKNLEAKFIVEELVDNFAVNLKEFSEDLLLEALEIYCGNDTQQENPDPLNLKLEEYTFLASDTLLHKSDKLKVVPEYNINNGDSSLNNLGIAKINLVPKLIETRVLYGFSRINEPKPLSAINREQDVEKGKRQLFINPSKHSWLPAYQVFGEGIYIEFNHDLLLQWENQFANAPRFFKLRERLNNARNNGVNVKETYEATPRYVLLHTLAHLMIQEIVLSCGYSSSSLKERIYYGTNGNDNMNGFLIYTASGDSEGTMGGLVRLGKEASLKEILEKALEKASWCSSDPICNEIGIDKGQGRDYLNGAACHNCTYVSEISCEEFNKYLDRGLIANYEEQPNFKSFFEFISTL